MSYKISHSAKNKSSKRRMRKGKSMVFVCFVWWKIIVMNLRPVLFTNFSCVLFTIMISFKSSLVCTHTTTTPPTQAGTLCKGRKGDKLNPINFNFCHTKALQPIFITHCLITFILHSFIAPTIFNNKKKLPSLLFM